MNSPGSVLMMPFSTVYRVITSARLAAYRSGVFRTTSLPVPVISVGNITTGGTGKTPLVEWVCRTIAETLPTEATDRKSVCVLTRGYGRENPNTQVVVSNGREVLASEREAGDEPFLLAKNLLGIAAVISNADRIGAGQWAIRNLGTEVFVLDDGFQHLRLARNLDIVTIDATNPFGGGELLPDGRLREPIDGLARADCVVITRSDQTADLESLKASVRRIVREHPIFSSRMATAGFSRIDGARIEAAEFITKPMAAFCGVGNPRSFFTQVRSAGVNIVSEHTFADHFKYGQSHLDALVKEAQATGAQGLITTAKDATKLGNLRRDLPCYVLQIEIQIDDEEHLRKMILEASSLAYS